MKERSSWLVPCNVKFYDVVAHFRNSDEVIWRQGRRFKPGDVAYLYISAPYSQILYKCEVIEAGIPRDSVPEEQRYAIRPGSKAVPLMRLKRVETFNEGSITLQDIVECGLGAVRTQILVPRRVQMIIDRVESSFR